LRGNHDLAETDTLPSVFASKAMVHCICLYSSLAYCICDFITDRSIANYQEIFESIRVEDKLATHDINYYPTQYAYMPLSTTNIQSSTPAIQEQLTTSPERKNIYDKVTRIIIDCDECGTYWQNHL